MPWRVVVAVVGGAALLGIVAAVAARGLPERASQGGPAPVDLTDARIGEFLAWVIIVLAAVIVIFTFWPTGSRPLRLRRPSVSIGRFLLSLAIITVVLLAIRPILPEDSVEAEPEDDAAVEEVAADGGGRPGWTFVLLAGALGAALGGIAIMGRRSRRDTEADLFRVEQLPDVRTGDAIDDEERVVRWGAEIEVTEPRRAQVVAAYGLMLRDLAASGQGRRAAEAPEEYLQRIEVSPPAAGAAHRLTQLFEVAGFSEQPTTDAMIAAASEALGAVRRDEGTEGP